jgi:AAA-like domain
MSQLVLQKINELLAPNGLTYIQEVVFLGAWEGKLYRQIADEAGYDYDYVKEVGFQLWQSLSDTLGRKVTKKNARLLLTKVAVPTDPGLELSAIAPPAIPTFEFPGGPLAADSQLYVERYVIEPIAYREILRPGGLVRIKAPQQMGKTSLVLRLIACAKENGLIPVTVNLQTADHRLLSNLNDFLRWLCLHISRQLNLEPQLDQYWDEESGSKISCNLYFELFLLDQIDSNIVLIFDEVTPLFDHPVLAQDVLPLFRIWHECAAQSKVWQKLRLIVVHNTELFVPLNLNQSPFNVGVPIDLADLTLDQITTLAQQYHLDEIQPDELAQLVALVGGHPYLIQLAFYWLQQDVPFDQLMKQAPTLAGIYRNELQRHWNRLQQNPNLLTAFKQILWDGTSNEVEMTIAYKLESMGLIYCHGNVLTVRCELYRSFFKVQLE